MRETGAPAVLFVSTGMSVHSGWGRQTTTLARSLAAEGVASVRFDLSGIGDSADRPDGRNPLFAPDGFADIAAAVDQIADTGAPIVLMGGCSGAYAAFQALCRDPRIAGALLINLYCFDWDPEQDLDRVIRQTFGSASTYAGLLTQGSTGGACSGSRSMSGRSPRPWRGAGSTRRSVGFAAPGARSTRAAPSPGASPRSGGGAPRSACSTAQAIPA
ncbi:alpha/beta hydrolase [Methylobacterium tardum]|uniref:alpha/beta hydrolase n=1 Tax=Methylobacterium tardum TaxID=374432 RepID=UPI00361A331B